MKALRCAIFSLLSPIAWAQIPSAIPDLLKACLAEYADDAKRLKCYDELHSYRPPDIPAKNQPQQKPNVQFLMRETGTVDNLAGLELGAKGGQVSIQRSGGTDATIAKIAAVAVFRPINELGWQPFASVGWNRDTSGKSPKDIRDLNLGVTGPLWDPLERGWTISHTARLTHRADIHGNHDGNTIGVQFNIIKLSWVTSTPEPAKNSYSFVPHLGWLHEARNSAAADGGNWRSLYLGASLDSKLNGILPRLTSSFFIRRLNDTTTPAANLRRRDRFASLSVEYELTDPQDKKIVVRPFLFISRDVGADSLAGTTASDKTTAGFRFKIN